MDAKLNKINEVILYAGVTCPSANDVLIRIQKKAGNANEDTIKMYVDAYKRYVFSYKIKNFDTEEKYIKASNKLINFDSFIFADQHLKSFPMPKTPLTNALFGDRDFFELYDKFLEVDAKIQEKRQQALIKFNLLKKEKENEKSKE